MLLKINGIATDTSSYFGTIGIVSETKGFMEYIHQLKADGFFMATFDKTPKEFFFGWIGHALKDGLHFILENDEFFLILPAIIIMFATFLIGKNKFSKFVIPLWVAYFITTILTQTSGLMDWLGQK